MRVVGWVVSVGWRETHTHEQKHSLAKESTCKGEEKKMGGLEGREANLCV